MTSTMSAPRRSAPPAGGSGRGEGARLAGVARRRRVPHLLAGVLLVAGCTASGVLVAAQLGQREAVLVLAEPVTVGQEISAGDVREVSMAVDPGVEVIGAGALEEVEGRTAAYSLPAGTVLTSEVLGEPRVPPAGQAVSAIPLARGQFPPGLQPGNTVRVVAAPAEGEGSEAGAPVAPSWTAVVTAVEGADERGEAVATLQMDADQAQAMAGWPAGELRLVIVAGGGS
ncbi:SAF domain-containing protein [Streptomyces sp. DSM 44917]|uniref:SAF domain-containing protein n=1 Tax=Streptomyces boetiae TaxID=3075541 RepID=A0ABU2L7K3_9ACTN|nr:SAF domain-containing protein [Streptomyces sp. DSM 44917]MDT0307273.1 SAF domain-containing protein [Streptomyces sp. DSM 44917]